MPARHEIRSAETTTAYLRFGQIETRRPRLRGDPEDRGM